jgi:hypothetical protein
MARSRNHRYSGNASMRSLCIVELRVAVNNIKLLPVAQQCFCGQFMCPATIRTEVFILGVRKFCNECRFWKFWVSPAILHGVKTAHTTV